MTRGNWLAGALIFFMPVLFIFFLGSQMAYSQVKGQFEAYQAIPEVTRLSELAMLPANQVVMLRGQMMAASCVPAKASACDHGSDLLIFRERPAEGREVRYQEEFQQLFPEVGLELADGAVVIQPSLTRERIIQHEPHVVSAGDRQYTGFRSGDRVTVQGQWQPGQPPVLVEVTGITSVDKTQLMLEWQAAFQKVGWARNGLGGLTLLGVVLLIAQWHRTKDKANSKDEEIEEETWQPQETKTAPIISP
jgi:hypothetical protein